jgi:hypothetical protein
MARMARRRRVVIEVVAMAFMALVTVISMTLNASAVPFAEGHWRIENNDEF